MLGRKIIVMAVIGGIAVLAAGWGVAQQASPAGQDKAKKADAVSRAQSSESVTKKRPEQNLRDADRLPAFAADKSPASSADLEKQPGKGRSDGFDPFKDAFGASKPNQPFDDVKRMDEEQKGLVTDQQRKLLEARYDLKPKFEEGLTMIRGKPIAVGPTARVAAGKSWSDLAKLSPTEIRRQGLFPYPALSHPKHSTGGMVFPKMQTEMFPRLERFDVEFDLPEAFLPEFPPAIFLQSRPELGDVSRGEVVSINNYYRLFKEIVTPVQLDGLRLLLTPFPQEEFNPTDDRKSAEPSLGVTCFDCHVNGHTTGQFHLNPDDRPQQRRFRIETVSLRGVNQQQIHGSKRSLRSVEDFTEFEQRTAYFNGDPIHAMKKGIMILDRIQVSHMAQMQNMFDFPPAPRLNAEGRLDAGKASETELRGEKLFFGKARCGACHPAPFYLDNLMHDLRTERFVDEAPLGQIKTFTLRGIKESPPYLHDGRCLTLEDTVEFFNLVLELQLSTDEKHDIVAFMRQL